MSTYQYAFARWRRARWEVCIAIDRGNGQDVGFIADNADLTWQKKTQAILRAYDSKTYVSLSSILATRSLHGCMALGIPNFLASLTTPEYVRHQSEKQVQFWMRLPMCRHVYSMERPRQQELLNDAPASDCIGIQIEEAGTVADTAAAILTGFSKQLARSLSVCIDDMDAKKPPYTFGVDSLVAVEFSMGFAGWISMWLRLRCHLQRPIVGFLSRQVGTWACPTDYPRKLVRKCIIRGACRVCGHTETIRRS